ncbi:MAG TPA: FMN reductase [Micromonosporaceae bacterium]|nr:FMN reductase [Micromonosporaceae bacterium]
MKQRSLAVVSAGLGQPSSTRLLADQLAEATRDELARRDVPVGQHLVELREHAHDVTNNLLTGFPSPSLQESIDAVAAADGLIAVTPIFNASYSGLFKSFFDVLGDTALVDKPVLIAATGGTARHSLALEHALRPMFAYLRAVVMPTSVFAAPEDWAGAVASGPLSDRIQRAAAELAEQVQRHEAKPVADPFALSATFEELRGAS